jgi:DNA-binding CsgD family transcriptional regulator
MKTGRGPRAATSAKSIREAERRAEILRLRLDGHSLSAIGDRMGIRADSVHDIITRALRAMTQDPSQELLTLELARLESLYAEAMSAVRAFTPVLHNGKIVQIPVIDSNGQTVKDPESGQPLTCVAQDRQPVLAGIACAIRISERRAKLLGLDAPIRAQTNLTVSSDEPERDLSKLSLDELQQLEDLMRKATATDAALLPTPQEKE